MSDLAGASLEDLYGEIRRRKPREYEMRQELGIRDDSLEPDYEAGLKRLALMALAAITLVLIALIAFLAATEREIPDLVSGLAGSGIGAIAGLLSSGSPKEAVRATSPG